MNLYGSEINPVTKVKVNANCWGTIDRKHFWLVV